MSLNPISVEYKQRAYDGKWQKLGLFPDRENIYRYTNAEGIKTTLVPHKWQTMAVYDYEMEFVD